MAKHNISFLVSITIILPLLLYFLAQFDGVLLWASVAVLFVPATILIAIWGVAIYQFRNGVQRSGDIITIPQMFGNISIEISQIRGLKAKKSIVGVLLDYSTLNILTENGASSNILIPDVIVNQLKTEFQTEKA